MSNAPPRKNILRVVANSDPPGVAARKHRAALWRWAITEAFTAAPHDARMYPMSRDTVNWISRWLTEQVGSAPAARSIQRHLAGLPLVRAIIAGQSRRRQGRRIVAKRLKRPRKTGRGRWPSETAAQRAAFDEAWADAAQGAWERSQKLQTE